MSQPLATSAKPRGRFKTIVATALIVIVVIVAFQNWDPTSVELLFITVKMPLLFLIATCFLIGVSVGWLIRKRRKG
ncbi:MAG: LapA family protein [Planctomycetota bacterium]|nr:LapA family protein [Planctomycetota bacterium]